MRRYFRNVRQTHVWILEKECVMPNFPNEIRRVYHPDCLHGNALEHAQDFHPNVAKILNNLGICHEALKYGSALLLCFGALPLQLQEKLQEVIQPPHILTNLMDPKFRGQHLSEEQEHSTEMWLADHHPGFLHGFLAFKIKALRFHFGFVTCSSASIQHHLILLRLRNTDFNLDWFEASYTIFWELINQQN
ncbi:hypothetical protein PR048_011085 [Dryococelus australis]|uniref:Uncharacterized protein n=1 Tax=Dryococelus australis TaxID=614101 RepID=A0ABQ9HL55_9NEOP|nr:hypothetical protein PR048_011085 [Dryococelus australis]